MGTSISAIEAEPGYQTRRTVSIEVCPVFRPISRRVAVLIWDQQTDWGLPVVGVIRPLAPLAQLIQTGNTNAYGFQERRTIRLKIGKNFAFLSVCEQTTDLGISFHKFIRRLYGRINICVGLQKVTWPRK